MARKLLESSLENASFNIVFQVSVLNGPFWP